VTDARNAGALTGEKILVVGATGQVAFPLTLSLAGSNEVWAAARFRNPDARNRLEEAGVRCAEIDLVAGSFGELPDDFSYVLNLSVVHTNNWGKALDGNAGGAGGLMWHCRAAKAFLHCSSTGVYQPDHHRRFAEGDPLGDSHRPLLPTYSISKVAAEAVVRFCARQLGLPTTIARLNVPYGDTFGLPLMHLETMVAGHPVEVHTDAPSLYNPIHADDILATVPKLLAVADVPATVVNWAGNDVVSVEDWCAYLGELTGLEPTFVHTDAAIPSVAVDLTRMHELIGPTTVEWRDGFRRMVSARHPELVG